MNQQSDPSGPVVLSYLSLRKAVGIIGLSLPFVLALGKVVLQGCGLQSSISGYYYTDVRGVFVGALCAIGVFLMSVRGFDRRDQVAGGLACLFAVGVALLPTTPDRGATRSDEIIGAFHLAFAALLFLTLAYFCLKLFILTDTPTPTPQKLQRNGVYRVCGYLILVSIFSIAVAALPQVKDRVAGLKPRFWLESVAVVAFGVAWLVKGEAILKDEQAQTPVGAGTPGAD